MCEEKRRLLLAYDGALIVVFSKKGRPNDDPQALLNGEAFQMAEDARVELEKHIQEHGC
jgi:hypothetical protein